MLWPKANRNLILKKIEKFEELSKALDKLKIHIPCEFAKKPKTLLEDDDSVEAVPSHWYKNQKCAWPRKNEKKNGRCISLLNVIEFDYLKPCKLGNKGYFEQEDSNTRYLLNTHMALNTVNDIPTNSMVQTDNIASGILNIKIKLSLCAEHNLPGSSKIQRELFYKMNRTIYNIEHDIMSLSDKVDNLINRFKKTVIGFGEQLAVENIFQKEILFEILLLETEEDLLFESKLSKQEFRKKN
ncbi:Hypothetical protein CINCED_3A023284 [Cinara cedri]|uniref:Uncharacterized protein n=1 Tax=Cinara cedri TaxID=506608 RepID=A0A5E4NC88_9HEMI|nr:Hypothetical protein CINCED_3A023284 [Cinara cedri]